jgi:ribosome biogenesis GTPase
MGNNIKKIKLKDLGYDTFFESNLKKLGLDNNSVARVIAEYRETYRVRTTNNEYLAKITGKQIFDALSREDFPAVGDWVVITELDKDLAVIQGILPRKTILRKKYSNQQEAQVIAANLDVAFIIESVDRDYNPNRLERFFVLAKEGNIKPVIILNKIDLISQTELNSKIYQIKNRFKDICIIPTSIIIEQGLDELIEYMTKGKTYCFLGTSGVGKSSLINKLIGQGNIKTNKVNLHTGKGRHTTTSREIYFLKNGGIVVDNPGMREVGIADSTIGIESVFDEIIALSKNCKYGNCTHTHEPGCAVLNAVKANELDENQYLNFVKLKKEAEYYDITELEKRKKDHQFGKFIKKALQQIKENES